MLTGPRDHAQLAFVFPHPLSSFIFFGSALFQKARNPITNKRQRKKVLYHVLRTFRLFLQSFVLFVCLFLGCVFALFFFGFGV